MRIHRPQHGKTASPDMRIARVAARQHGVVSRRQLLAMGFSNDAIWHRVRTGRLHAIHRGVYSVGHPLLLRRSGYMAAVLACGGDAVLSHRAAGAVLGLRATPGGPIDVTITAGGSRRQRGIAVHVTRSLPDGEVTVCDGIPVTTWFRTIVDLAAVAQKRELRRALQRSMELRLFDRGPLDATLAHSRGRRGTGLLRTLLAELPDEPAPARLELERRFLDLTEDHGLPAPAVNAAVLGYEVDFHWPSQRLIVETDGRATHDTAYRFEEDRRRDLALTEAGWHVVRLSWRQVVNEPERVAALLRSRLS